jgi:hypothetical protein
MAKKPHKLTPRELVQVVAALRYWGRVSENAGTNFMSHPCNHPMVKARFKFFPPMTLDEIETLIGQLDGSWTKRGLRTWDGFRYL